MRVIGACAGLATAIGVVVTTVGCGDEPAAPTATSPPNVISSELGGNGSCSVDAATSYFAPKFACDSKIKVRIDIPGESERGTVKSAVQAWSRLVFEPVDSFDLPQIEIVSQNQDFTIRLDESGYTGGEPKYCGTAAGDITIYKLSGTTCGLVTPAPRVVPQLKAVALHEFGNRLGLKDNIRNRNATGACVMTVPDPPDPMNEALCEHERQIVYSGYSLRDSVDLDNPIASAIQLDILGSHTVAPGDTLRVEVDVYSRTLADEEIGELVPFIGAHAVAWSIGPPSFASAAEIVFESADEVLVAVDSAAQGLSGYISATLVEGANVAWPAPTDTVAISVPSEPPPPPLSVDIIGPEDVGPNTTCEWFASVDGGSPPYSYEWTGGGWKRPQTTSYVSAVTPSKGSFVLQLSIEDGSAEVASDSLTVVVHPYMEPCPPT